MSPARKKAAPPQPIRYCAIHHGGMPFPEIINAALADSAVDPFERMALIKRTVCTAVGNAGLPCDPVLCASRLEPHVTGYTGAFVNACKRTWTYYHDEAYGDKQAPANAAWSDLLDETEWSPWDQSHEQTF